MVEEQIEEVNTPLQNISSINIRNNNQPSHKFNLGYHIEFDSLRQLDIFADYRYQSSSQDEDINQQDQDTQERVRFDIYNKNRAHVSSLRAEYNSPLYGSKLLLGVNYNYINSNTDTDYDKELFSTLITNNAIALYSILGTEYPQWGYSAGLRYEFSDDDLLLTGDETGRRTE